MQARCCLAGILLAPLLQEEALLAKRLTVSQRGLVYNPTSVYHDLLLDTHMLDILLHHPLKNFHVVCLQVARSNLEHLQLHSLSHY